MTLEKDKSGPVTVYIVSNNLTGKSYIGVTSRKLERRWRDHVCNARRGKQGALPAAIRKYGETAFSVAPFAMAFSRLDAVFIEMKLIAQQKTKYPLGYNLTDGGDGVIGLDRAIVLSTAQKNLGRKHSDEAKRLISVAGKGRKHTAQARSSIAEKHRGKKLSEDHCKKLSIAKTGKKLKPRSAEHAAKISEGLKMAWARRRELK